MKKIVTFIKMILILLGCTCLGTLMLFLVYLLPVDSMNGHLKESVSIFEFEGTYPELVSWCTSSLDNWTDAIMLLSAAYTGDDATIDKVLMVYTERLALEKEPTESLIKRYKESANEFIVNQYSRYWHGYLLFLKPLLSIMSYGEIRVLNLYLQLTVIFVLLFVICQKGYNNYVFPIFLLMGMLPILPTAYSMQYSSVFYIFMVGLIILFLKFSKWHNTDKMVMYFMMLGVSTSYFDILTYPLVTFGIPICIYFCISENTNFSESIKYLLLYGFAWGMGYGGMWGSKWIVVSIFTNQNIALDVLGAIKTRTSMTAGWGDEINILEMLFCNFKAFTRNPFIIFVIMFCIHKINQIVKFSNGKKEYMIFIVISFLPVLWYIAIPNHSMTHWWLFTYKELLITAFAILCFCTKMADGNLKLADNRNTL